MILQRGSGLALGFASDKLKAGEYSRGNQPAKPKVKTFPFHRHFIFIIILLSDPLTQFLSQHFLPPESHFSASKQNVWEEGEGRGKTKLPI
jgi:hypothetical protein